MCFIENPALPFYNDYFDRPNAIRMVRYVSDPYDYEVYGKTDMKWLCRGCYHELEMDI
jgi:hypothetical protein